MMTIQHSPASKIVYDRTRVEHKRHSHAVLSLAPRHVDVMQAMLHDQRRYQERRPNLVAAA